MNRKLISLIISALFVTVIIFRELLYGKFWIFAGIPILVSTIGILLVIFLNLKKDRFTIYISIIALLVGISIMLVEETEIFKSRIVLKAFLVDDVSSLELTLRENHKFELLPESYLGRSESINGNYRIEGNKIIFLNKPFKDRLISDTVYIMNNKIILRFDSDGIPDTTFKITLELIHLKEITLANKG
ncbi:MAG: hypothetical protein IPN18_16455 [Ignavibacteriales bacterium]|nr:hypothetical protein [Ignavibacteriales bacterium]